MNELDRMRELKQKGFYCSQILLIMGMELQGRENPDLVAAMHTLADGIGFSGETCGALTGGVCLLGLYAGKGRPEQDEDPRLLFMAEDLVRWFKDEYGAQYGGIRCDRDPRRQDHARPLPRHRPGHVPENQGAVSGERFRSGGRGMVSLTGESVLSQTESVCPECLARIPAQRVALGEDVYLDKSCPEHGDFSTVIWRGGPAFATWVRPKLPSHPEAPFTMFERGCPYDCGLCPDHRQHTCSVLLELTAACDLGCPVCFADAGTHSAPDPDLKTIAGWYRRLLDAGGPFNIQLSGGEPCLRDDLPQIIALGRSLGFTFFQLNTNGLRLARDPDYLQRLRDAGLSTVFLQFDGAPRRDSSGAPRASAGLAKRAAIEHCIKHGMSVVLVPTLAPGVNTDDIGAIVEFALRYAGRPRRALPANQLLRSLSHDPYRLRTDHDPRDYHCYRDSNAGRDQPRKLSARRAARTRCARFTATS